MFLLLPSLFSC